MSQTPEDRIRAKTEQLLVDGAEFHDVGLQAYWMASFGAESYMGSIGIWFEIALASSRASRV